MRRFGKISNPYATLTALAALVALISMFSLSPLAQARTVLIYDIDGTLLEYRAENGGTFSTPYILFRVKHRDMSITDQPKGSEIIEVGQDEFERFEKMHAFANGEGQLGRTDLEITTTTGEKVPAGWYQTLQVAAADTYKYYQGSKYLLRDFKKAEDQDPSGKWQGQVWGLTMFMINHGATTAALTMRDRQLKPFYEHLLAEKYISQLPTDKHDMTLGSPDWDILGRNHGSSEMKFRGAEQMIDYWSSVPFDHKTERPILNADGDRLISGHTLIIAEDEPQHIEAILRIAKDRASRKAWTRTPLKFIFISAASKAELALSGRPRIFAVDGAGGERKVHDVEIVGSVIGGKEKISKAMAKKLILPSYLGIESETKMSASLCEWANGLTGETKSGESK